MKYIFSLLLFIIPLDAAHESDLLKRIHAHMIIKDYSSAYEESKNAIISYPPSEPLYKAHIRVLAKLGYEKELFQAWKEYHQAFPNSQLDRDLIENIAWGVLQKASYSSSLIMRQMALLAAFFSQEMHGVNILYSGMQNSNYSIRAVAVKLAGQMRDNKLISAMKRLLAEEKVWLVKKEVIEAVGGMKILELRPQLEALISSENSLAEEKALAIASLLNLLKKVDRTEVARLAVSNRAGLRLLASKAIAHFNSTRDLDLLYAMTKDHHSDVRASAFQAIGLLRPTDKVRVAETARNGVADPHYKVALSAAWLLTLYEPYEGQKTFQKHLLSDKKEARLLASVALAATGRYGVNLALTHFTTHRDPFVRLNLALGLAGQQIALDQVSLVLEQVLASEKNRWGETSWGHFQIISSQNGGGDNDSSSEIDNQLTRLKVLNRLAILKSPQAQGAIHQFLLERNWGISASAAALLLTEGDDAAIELVQNLLEDGDSKVRLQAALVLSLWSRDERAIEVLEKSYLKSDTDQKAKILEGIGRIGSMRSVPFLLERLEEPSQTLRLISAMAIIQCLNH